jgi:hypothetical protein
MSKGLIIITMALSCLAGFCLPVLAQQATAGSAAVAPAEVEPPRYPILFPNPTNNNGFEEFVQAADQILGMEDIDDASYPGASLALKRRVLARAECKRALELMREGLAKPAVAPSRPQDAKPGLPFGQFIRLARLLATEQYVDYANGKVDAAVDSLQVGLRFGYRVQQSSIMMGLTGIMVDAIVLSETAAHLDQLSVFNCDNLVQLAKDLVAADCPGIRLLELAKTDKIDRLDSMKMDGDNLLALVAANSNLGSADLSASLMVLENQLATQPESVNSVVSDAKARIAEQFDLAAQDMRLPALQRKPLAADSSNSPGSVISRSLTWSLPRLVDRYTGDQARVRLLGVHALIKRYQWDHNALPASLSELHVDDLVIDPFTGDRLIYKLVGDRYTLSSAGPMVAGTAQRDPVGLR